MDVRQSFLASAQSILASPDSRSRSSCARALAAGRASPRIAAVVEMTPTLTRTAPIVAFLLAALSGVAPASAQSPLSLDEAIRRARTQNPDVLAAAAAEQEADERVTQARGGNLPRVDFAESWQRGNHPAFVFSSRLSQRQLVASDLALDALNHPATTDNFRAAFSVEQSLFDPATRARIRSASIGREMAATGRQLVAQGLTSAVADAFGQVLIAAAAMRSAAAAVNTARADRELAANRRDAGRVTDADVLQLDVHLARTLERQVKAISDERIARARLNQLMGEPLSMMFQLELTAPADAIDLADGAALEAEAVKNRPEIAQATQQERLADAAVTAARAEFLPRVAAHGAWELDGATWSSRSSGWVVGAAARINLFQGLADRARLAEAHQQVIRRGIERNKAETMVRLDVQIAIARLEAARASELVGRAAADSARASQRIIRDRYENGLADVTLLLRAADAVEQAETQQITAHVNVLTAGANLRRARGQS